ncbi:hypothetical protein CONLIGDRAFT_703077 [Coniochaeta ligniaria NRRL 30616]|uniref:Uncharacterized protein n=1 Tax=Coniochaeta ligniaria NRRL 30616 TaxID=1408157 RepID=A0A1J7J3S3_9PEZI|nr:hypothetical protein CONLIGDRAFT_703077 [Coniochaeta ligniaria NRRL 30616]
MVDLSSSPMITGIIDWDGAVFAPAFVADRAPSGAGFAAILAIAIVIFGLPAAFGASRFHGRFRSQFLTPVIMTTNTETWQSKAAAKQAAILATIPEEWRLSPSQLKLAYGYKDTTSTDAIAESFQTSQVDLAQRAIGFNCLNYAKAAEGSLYRHYLPTNDYLDANCANSVRFEMTPCHNTFQGPLGTVSTYSAAGCADVQANFANETWT